MLDISAGFNVSFFISKDTFELYSCGKNLIKEKENNISIKVQ